MPSATSTGRIVRSLSLLVGAVVIAGSCAGSPPEVEAGPDGAQDPELVLGREVFGDRCSSCHGNAGDGGTGPRLAGQVGEKYPDAAGQAEVVRDGRNSMPSFRGSLSEAQLAAVVRYTREVLS